MELMKNIMFGKFTFLTMLLSLFITGNAFAQIESNFYTLDFTAKNNFFNTWDASHDYTSEGVVWDIYGAHNNNGWPYMRTGGKPSGGKSKTSYYASKSRIGGTVSKVVLQALNVENTPAPSFDIEKVTLYVCKDSEFKSLIDECKVIVDTDITLTFSPSIGAIWEKAYYKLVFTWKNSYAKEKYGMDVQKVKFYTTEPVANIGSTCYSTLYYSDHALTVPEKVMAMTYKVNNEKLVVSKEYKAGEIIPAGEAVVLKAEGSGKYVFSESADTDVARDDNNMLRGSDVEEETTGGSVYYKLSLNSNNDPESIGFYWGAENGAAFTNGAHKAYLALANALSKSYVLGNATSGLTTVETDNVGHDAVFNLSGLRVGSEYKGIVVENGKKIIRK